jgi:hypothetical protein
MLAFKKPLKIYLFKDKQSVDITIRITDAHAHTYSLPVLQFEQLIAHWLDPNGWSAQTPSGQHWFVHYKTTTPRPESAAASYVRISVNHQQYRVDHSDMTDLAKDYFYQANNKMYWD